MSKKNISWGFGTNGAPFDGTLWPPCFTDIESNGTYILTQELSHLEGIIYFPPIPMIQKVLKHLEQQQVKCVMILPGTFSPLVNKVAYVLTDPLTTMLSQF